MKIFHFDPTTGKRGDFIEATERASWTGQGVEYQVKHGIIEPIEYHKPIGFGRNAEVTVHVDAGRGFIGEEVSYVQPDKWICFCLGAFNPGQGQDTWVWVVLPPQTEIKPIQG